MLLVYVGSSENKARKKATELGLFSPVAMDSDSSLYMSYPRPPDDAYAPFPLHVLVRPDGTLGYVRTQWDMSAAMFAIESAL